MLDFSPGIQCKKRKKKMNLYNYLLISFFVAFFFNDAESCFRLDIVAEASKMWLYFMIDRVKAFLVCHLSYLD